MSTQLNYTSLLRDMQVYAERAFTQASDPLVFDQLPRLINLAERRCARELKVQGFITNAVWFFTVGESVYSKPDRWREWISINMGTDTLFSTVSRQSAAGIRTLVLEKPHPYVVGDEVIITGLGGSGYNSSVSPTVQSFTLTAVDQLSIEYQTGAVTEAVTADDGGLVSMAMERRIPLLSRSYEYVRGYWPDARQLGQPLFYADYDYTHFIVGPTPLRPYPYEVNYYELPPLLDASNQSNWLSDYAPNLLLYATLLEMAPFLKNKEQFDMWQGMYDRSMSSLTGEDMEKIQDRTAERSKP